MNPPASVAILHYTLPPVVGGVEAVILAQARAFASAGYQTTLIGGSGDINILPEKCSLLLIPEMNSRYPEIVQINNHLVEAQIPEAFSNMVKRLIDVLKPVLARYDHVIIHNVMTKHFNLPLTAALISLVEMGVIRHAIAWCHDFSWTSPSSLEKIHPGYPWELLRTPLKNTTYVTVSRKRQQELADLFNVPIDAIHLAYNGVESGVLLGLSDEGLSLIERLDLSNSDLILLMPVRITRAKNIEYAFQVLASLKKMCHSPRLILTGPPDPHDPQSMQYFHSLQTLRDQLGLRNEAKFVFESGPDLATPYIIPERLVGELFRVSDVMFMPSHKEGFGMPVLEAGLAGIPVVSTSVPASLELGEQNVFLFSLETSPRFLAQQILTLITENPISRFRQSVRQNYIWSVIFQHSIEPLLVEGWLASIP